MAYSGCDIIDASIAGMISNMEKINRKIDGLRRLAELIEEASDPRFLIPDISRLIPIERIDVDSYEALRQSCPMLNLPSAQLGLDKLKADLVRAYTSLINSLNLHPLVQLTGMVDMLERFIRQAGIDYSCVYNYLQCARVACSAAGQMSASLERDAAVVDEYGKNILNTTSAVLSEKAQERRAQLNAIRDQLQNLTK